MRREVKAGEYVVLFYRDGSVRQGKLVDYRDDCVILENVEGNWTKRGGLGYMPEINYSQIFVPYFEVKEFAIAK